MTNEQKLKNRKKRQVLKVLIIIFGLATLVLAIYSLITKFSPIPAIITFVVEAVLSKYRTKLDPKVVNPDSKN